MATSPYKWKILERDVKPYKIKSINQSINQSIKRRTFSVPNHLDRKNELYQILAHRNKHPNHWINVLNMPFLSICLNFSAFMSFVFYILHFLLFDSKAETSVPYFVMYACQAWINEPISSLRMHCSMGCIHSGHCPVVNHGEHTPTFQIIIIYYRLYKSSHPVSEGFFFQENLTPFSPELSNFSRLC
jgi:hypothetical protein